MIGQAGGAAQRKLVLNVIWVAMTGAVGVYWGIRVLVGEREPNAESSPLVLVLAGLAFAEAAGAWMFHRLTLAAIAQQVSRAQAAPITSEAAAALAQRLQAAPIICLALFEAIVVYGLVAHFVGPLYANTFEGFAAVGLLNLVAYRLQAYPAIFTLLDQLEAVGKRHGV